MSSHSRMVWWLLWPIGACFVVFGELGFWLNGFAPRETFPLDLAVSSVSIAVGLILWRLRPGNRTGLLLFLVGVMWTIGGIRAYGNPWAFGVGQCFDGAQDVVLAHLIIAYPSGRLKTRRLRLLVSVGYGLLLVNLAATMTWTLPGGHNGLAVWDAPGVHNSLRSSYEIVGGIYAVLGIAIITHRWVHATSAGRRVLGPVLAASLFFAFTEAVDLLYTGLVGSEPNAVFFPPLIARLLIPLAFLVGLARDQLAPGPLGRLVVQLDAAGVETMQEALARTLHDPSLQLAYKLPNQDQYVTVRGEILELPADNEPQVATLVERNGEPLAAIVHDHALLEHPHLVQSVTAAARLALDNERLQAQLRNQLNELKASRARIVQAADRERRKLERDLHDGAQQHLLAVGLALQLLRPRLDDTTTAGPLLSDAETELTQALDELRELARGIHPAVLTDQGLAAAANTLAIRAPIPVVVSAAKQRLPAAVETAGYYLIAETLTNITKHAHATKATVTIERRNGSARISVCDDGVGGANPTDGSGLAGLADRIGALDGTLEIASIRGHGTTVTADIPCG